MTEIYNDLLIQAMMFDMDIDFETVSIVPKIKDTTPVWVKKWKEKENGKDYTVIDNGF